MAPPPNLDPGSDTEDQPVGIKATTTSKPTSHDTSRETSTPAQPPANDRPAPTPADDDADADEDDYLNMTFNEPTNTAPESSLQRRQRLRKEAEARSRPKSKAELAAEAEAQRTAGLNTQLDASNKGFKMMAKLGFKAGSALGKEGGDARTEPIAVDVKGDRGGIGADAEKKRKVREEFETAEREVKRKKVEEGDYRERVRREREEARQEGQFIGAMKVCERLEEGEGDEDGGGECAAAAGEKAKRGPRPLQSIPVEWRGLVRHRLEKDREKRLNQSLHNSIGGTSNGPSKANSGLPTYDDPTEDADYKRAFGKEVEEIEEEDPELDAFNELPPDERLEKVVKYLRQKHWYCFWCKWRYEDEGMDGCPGSTEEEHD